MAGEHSNHMLAAWLKEMPCVQGSCQVAASHKGAAVMTRNASSSTMHSAVSDSHSAGKSKMGWNSESWSDNASSGALELPG